MQYLSREKKNSTGTSHRGFPWSLLVGFVALKGKKAFYPAGLQLAKLKIIGSDLLSCDCVHWRILHGFLLLSSSEANITDLISWYQLHFLSGHLLKVAIPVTPRTPDSEGVWVIQATREARVTASAPYFCRSKWSAVEKGSATADQTREGLMQEDNVHEGKRATWWYHVVNVLEKKHNLNFQVCSNKNMFKINQRLTAEKFLLNTLNNFGLRSKATGLISTFCGCWVGVPLGTKPKKGIFAHSHYLRMLAATACCCSW